MATIRKAISVQGHIEKIDEMLVSVLNNVSEIEKEHPELKVSWFMPTSSLGQTKLIAIIEYESDKKEEGKLIIHPKGDFFYDYDDDDDVLK